MPYIFSFKKLISAIILFLIFGLVMIKSNNIIYDRYINQLKEHLVVKKQNETIYFPEHIGLFNSAYESFLENNKLIGSGVKSFRETCKFNNSKFKENLDKIKNTNFCSTHPHNYYLQFLSELGLIGFLFLIGVFIFCIIKYFNSLYFFFLKKNNE